jgi:hypothetical protein
VKSGKLFIGIDIERNLWRVSIYHAEGGYTSFQLPPDPQLLKKYIDDKFKNVKVVCAYRNKPDSSWIHRLLTSYNYECLVFDPQAVPLLDGLDGNAKIDSRTIADILRKGWIKSVFPNRNFQYN